MASNQIEAINRAIRDGDAGGALVAYDNYVQSMVNAGQRPKSPQELGIKTK